MRTLLTLLLGATRADDRVDWARRRVVRVFDAAQMSMRGGFAMTDRRGRPYRCALKAADAHRKPASGDAELRPADKALRNYARWRAAADVCDVLAASKDQFWSYELCFGRYVTQFRPARPAVRGGMLEPGTAHGLGNYTVNTAISSSWWASPGEVRGVFGDALDAVYFPPLTSYDALVETYPGGTSGRKTTVYVGCALAARGEDAGAAGAKIFKDTHTAVKRGAVHGAGDARDARDPARVAIVLEPTPHTYRMFVAAPMACTPADLASAIAGRAARRLNATCLQKRRHDWTYEVCPGHLVRRFQGDTSQDLGAFEGFNVSAAGVVAQSYEGGATCALGGTYRTTVAFECSRHEGKREKVALAAVFETSACAFEAVVHLAALCDPPNYEFVGDDTLDHLDCVADHDDEPAQYPGCLGRPGAWVAGGCGMGLRAVLRAAANNKFTKSVVREAQYLEVFSDVDVADIPALTAEDWAELGLTSEDRAFIKQAHKDLHPEFWWADTTEGREWLGDFMQEGEFTFLEARSIRRIRDGMAERLGELGFKAGEKAPREVVEEAARDLGFNERYLASIVHEYAMPAKRTSEETMAILRAMGWEDEDSDELRRDDYEDDYRDDYEVNDARLEREAREGLARNLRKRGYGEKAPRAVVEAAFADYVRMFLASNEHFDAEDAEEVFADIFAGIADDFVREDDAEERDEPTFPGHRRALDLIRERRERDARQDAERRVPGPADADHDYVELSDEKLHDDELNDDDELYDDEHDDNEGQMYDDDEAELRQRRSHAAAQTRRLAAELRRGIELRLRARGASGEKIGVADVEAAFREHLKSFLASQPASVGSDTEDAFAEMFKYLEADGIVDDLLAEFSDDADGDDEDDDELHAAALAALRRGVQLRLRALGLEGKKVSREFVEEAVVVAHRAFLASPQGEAFGDEAGEIFQGFVDNLLAELSPEDDDVDEPRAGAATEGLEAEVRRVVQLHLRAEGLEPRGQEARIEVAEAAFRGFLASPQGKTAGDDARRTGIYEDLVGKFASKKERLAAAVRDALITMAGELYDLETGELLPTDPGRVRATFIEKLGALAGADADAIVAALRGGGIDAAIAADLAVDLASGEFGDNSFGDDSGR